MAFGTESMAGVFLTVAMTMFISLIYTCQADCSDKANVKKSDDVSMHALEVLVQQQAATIQQQGAMMQQQGSRIEQLEAVVQTLQSNMATQENSLQSFQSILSAAKVAFTVRFLNDNNSAGLVLSHQQTLKFDNVITNIGNGYDSQTGLFTAPVSGVYAFFLSAMAVNSNGDLDLVIEKHGVLLDIVYAQGAAGFNDQGSSQVSTHLTAGEQVWVRQETGSRIRGGPWTVYTGYLVQPD